jgi:hypothetical protein
MTNPNRPKRLTARNKLNVAYFLGSLVLAAVLGGATGSWAVFWLALLALLIASVVTRDIRF